MEHYKILGVDENATMEEVTKAYEKKVNEFKTDINDEKRAKAFIKIFDTAYENIKLERKRQYNDNTVIMGVKELEHNTGAKQQVKYDVLEATNERNSSKSKAFTREDKERKKYSGNSSSKTRKKKNKKNTAAQGTRETQRDRSTKKKPIDKKKSEGSILGTIIQLPLKAIALVGIIILSILLLLCKVISLASWLISRLVMAAAIGLASIHGYQIYIGHAIRYEIFILCAIAFIIALFLPSIVRIIPSMIGGVNDKLKEYVF